MLLSIGGLAFVFLYFAPTLFAIHRQHERLGIVMLVNMFLAWTLIGWALAWRVALTPQEGESGDPWRLDFGATTEVLPSGNVQCRKHLTDERQTDERD